MIHKLALKEMFLSLRLKSSIEFADLISSGKLFQSSRLPYELG